MAEVKQTKFVAHSTSLKMGDKAPTFKAKDQNGKLISSTDLKGKNIILYFCTMKVRRAVILLIFTCFIVGVCDAQGCSQCRMLSEQSAELDENSFGSSINFGILYLMVVPYLLLMFLFRKRIAKFFRQMSSR